MEDNDDETIWNHTVPQRRMNAIPKLQIAIQSVLEMRGWLGSLKFWRAKGFTPTSRRLVIAFLVPAYCEELAAEGHEMELDQWETLAEALADEALKALDCEQ